MTGCCAPDCTNNHPTLKLAVSFNFPTDPRRLALWLKHIPSGHSIEYAGREICIEHFEPCYIQEIDSHLTLTDDAIPTIFPGVLPTEPAVEPAPQPKMPAKSTAKPPTGLRGKKRAAAIALSQSPPSPASASRRRKTSVGSASSTASSSGDRHQFATTAATEAHDDDDEEEQHNDEHSRIDLFPTSALTVEGIIAEYDAAVSAGRLTSRLAAAGPPAADDIIAQHDADKKVPVSVGRRSKGNA